MESGASHEWQPDAARRAAEPVLPPTNRDGGVEGRQRGASALRTHIVWREKRRTNALGQEQIRRIAISLPYVSIQHTPLPK
jgi:hypothetical protein